MIVVVFVVIIVAVVLLILAISHETICLFDPKDRNGTQSSNKRESPPRDDHISFLDAEGERGSDKGRPTCPSDSADAGAHSVQCPQNVQAARGVGQEDGARGETEDDTEEFKEHEKEDGKIPDRIGQEHDEWRDDV